MALEGRRLAVVFGFALIFWGTPLVLLAPQPGFGAAVVLLAVVGAANSVEDVAVFTLIQRLVPDDVLTRVLGLVWGSRWAPSRWARSRRPRSSSAVGTGAAFAVVGAILPLLAIVSYRRLAEIDRAVAPAAELDLVKGMPMFAPLSIAAKERVAANLIPSPSRPATRSSGPARSETASTSSAAALSRSTHRRRVTAGARRLLRRDRVAAGRPAHGDRHGDLRGDRLRAGPRRLSRRRHGPLGHAAGREVAKARMAPTTRTSSLSVSNRRHPPLVDWQVRGAGRGRGGRNEGYRDDHPVALERLEHLSRPGRGAWKPPSGEEPHRQRGCCAAWRASERRVAAEPRLGPAVRRSRASRPPPGSEPPSAWTRPFRRCCRAAAP